MSSSLGGPAGVGSVGPEWRAGEEAPGPALGSDRGPRPWASEEPVESLPSPGGCAHLCPAASWAWS